MYEEVCLYMYEEINIKWKLNMYGWIVWQNWSDAAHTDFLSHLSSLN